YSVLAALWPVVTWATREACPVAFVGIGHRPLAWLGAGAAVLGLIAAFSGLRSGRPLAAFLGSCSFIAGLLGATSALTFPVLLPSTGDSARSITAYAAASPAASLRTAMGWFSIGVPLAIGYFVVLFRLHRGKVVAAADGEGY